MSSPLVTRPASHDAKGSSGTRDGDAVLTTPCAAATSSPSLRRSGSAGDDVTHTTALLTDSSTTPLRSTMQLQHNDTTTATTTTTAATAADASLSRGSLQLSSSAFTDAAAAAAATHAHSSTTVLFSPSPAVQTSPPQRQEQQQLRTHAAATTRRDGASMPRSTMEASVPAPIALHATRAHYTYSPSQQQQRQQQQRQQQQRQPSTSSPCVRRYNASSLSCARRGRSPHDTQRRRSQREKQVQYGYVTAGYKNMLRLVASDPLLRSGGVLPLAPPDMHIRSKRLWDIQLRKWRRALHMFDEVYIDGLDDDDARAGVLEAQRRQWVSEHYASLPRDARVQHSIAALLAVRTHSALVPRSIPVDEALRCIVRSEACGAPVRAVVPHTASSLIRGTDISPLEAGIKIHIAPSAAVLQRQHAQHALQQQLAQLRAESVRASSAAAAAAAAAASVATSVTRRAATSMRAHSNDNDKSDKGSGSDEEKDEDGAHSRSTSLSSLTRTARWHDNDGNDDAASTTSTRDDTTTAAAAAANDDAMAASPSPVRPVTDVMATSTAVVPPRLPHRLTQQQQQRQVRQGNATDDTQARIAANAHYLRQRGAASVGTHNNSGSDGSGSRCDAEAASGRASGVAAFTATTTTTMSTAAAVTDAAAATQAHGTTNTTTNTTTTATTAAKQLWRRQRRSSDVSPPSPVQRLTFASQSMPQPPSSTTAIDDSAAAAAHTRADEAKTLTQPHQVDAAAGSNSNSSSGGGEPSVTIPLALFQALTAAAAANTAVTTTAASPPSLLATCAGGSDRKDRSDAMAAAHVLHAHAAAAAGYAVPMPHAYTCTLPPPPPPVSLQPPMPAHTLLYATPAAQASAATASCLPSQPFAPWPSNMWAYMPPVPAHAAHVLLQQQQQQSLPHAHYVWPQHQQQQSLPLHIPHTARTTTTMMSPSPSLPAAAAVARACEAVSQQTCVMSGTHSTPVTQHGRAQDNKRHTPATVPRYVARLGTSQPHTTPSATTATMDAAVAAAASSNQADAHKTHNMAASSNSNTAPSATHTCDTATR